VFESLTVPIVNPPMVPCDADIPVLSSLPSSVSFASFTTIEPLVAFPEPPTTIDPPSI
jgi:hypothetical protein